MVAALCGIFWGLMGSPAFGVDDVTVRLNGGANVAYIGQANTLEILIRNDQPFTISDLPFRISIGRAYSFNATFGNKGYADVAPGVVSQLGTVYVTPKINNSSPDTVRIASVNFSSDVPAHNPATLCYTLQFTINAGATPLPGGVCIDNISYTQDTTQALWALCKSGCAAPLFQGVTNSGTSNPSAPAVCFDIVAAAPFAGNGDVNCDGNRNSGDIIWMVNYVFKSGPSPCPGP
jgi:hypothetical protein